jgi:asparagine synthase (glutamine-hydrolysing)
VDDKRVLCHERLGIVDPVSGAQPLFNQTGTVALTVNGEIYNHKSLRQSLFNDYNFKTASDCEVIIPLVSSSHLLSSLCSVSGRAFVCE